MLSLRISMTKAIFGWIAAIYVKLFETDANVHAALPRGLLQCRNDELRGVFVGHVLLRKCSTGFGKIGDEAPEFRIGDGAWKIFRECARDRDNESGDEKTELSKHSHPF